MGGIVRFTHLYFFTASEKTLSCHFYHYHFFFKFCGAISAKNCCGKYLVDFVYRVILNIYLVGYVRCVVL